jgi:TRAP-type C4-dicarboxylate transport system permease small subunit
MKNAVRWITKGSEAVAAAMLAALFLTFMLQIISRYIMDSPFGWTLELCLTLWVWIVFFGCAMIVRDRDHVTFDIVYLAFPRGVRRVLALISAGAIAVGLIWSLLPTWDYIDFLRIKRSSTLRIPMRTVFSVYAFFLVVVALRYAWAFAETLRKGPPDEAHEIHVGEEG